jgi:general secretion pathway protein M
MMTRDWLTNHSSRKAIFLGANLAACIAVLYMVIQPISDFFADRDVYIAQQLALLARLSAIAAQDTNVQAAAREAVEEAKRGELLVGPNEGVISANLQTRLKATAEQAGAHFRSVQSLPISTTEQLKFAGSRIEIYGSLQAIERALYAIETGRPYLFITAATIRPTPGPNGQNPREEPVIEARLEVFGAIEVEERKP